MTGVQTCALPIFSLFEAGEIWVADLSAPRAPKVTKFKEIGRQPYDALVTPDGRYYLAGLFGEDGVAMLDLWHPERGVRRILDGYGRGEQPLPVYKMPHLEGWAVAGNLAYLPAVGRHEVLVVDTTTWREAGRIKVAGQPVFVMARPDGRQVWVNFAHPLNDTVQVIDTPSGEIVHTLTRSQPDGWTGHRRRVDRDMLAQVTWPATEQPRCFVCGPTGFVETVTSALVDRKSTRLNSSHMSESRMPSSA